MRKDGNSVHSIRGRSSMHSMHSMNLKGRDSVSDGAKIRDRVADGAKISGNE